MAGSSEKIQTPPSSFKRRCYRVIFHSDRFYEKLFDVVLIAAILLSVLAVMLESVRSIRDSYGPWLLRIEWFFTLLFTVEYGLRIYVAPRRFQYVKSFFGVVDLLSILPTYLDLFFPGLRYLMSLRVLRVLRIFRVLKMAQYMGEASLLTKAIRASSRKIAVFIFWVVTLVSLLGSVMYLIEGAENGFTSIPKSVYWAIVTLTTVGYGDISPQTPAGQVVASIVMILGYGIIAVPTGIVTAEIAFASRSEDLEKRHAKKICPHCRTEAPSMQSRYCHNCGEKLDLKGS